METKKVDWQLVILVCSIIIIMIMGVRQSLGLFLDPITSFMKSGKEFFSFAIGVQAIIWMKLFTYILLRIQCIFIICNIYFYADKLDMIRIV